MEESSEELKHVIRKVSYEILPHGFGHREEVLIINPQVAESIMLPEIVEMIVYLLHETLR